MIQRKRHQSCWMISAEADLAGSHLRDLRHKAEKAGIYMKGIIKELLGWLVFILLLWRASYLVITYVGQRTEVSGSSMETTLSDGDQLIVDKISYRFRDPSRYDIVVFHIGMKKIHIISRGSSDFRERQCRLWTVLSGSTDSLFMSIMAMK